MSDLINATSSEHSDAQEQAINALLMRLQSAVTTDELLQTALVELGQAFGATRGSIRLGQPDSAVVRAERPGV